MTSAAQIYHTLQSSARCSRPNVVHQIVVNDLLSGSGRSLVGVVNFIKVNKQKTVVRNHHTKHNQYRVL